MSVRAAAQFTTLRFATQVLFGRGTPSPIRRRGAYAVRYDSPQDVSDKCPNGSSRTAENAVPATLVCLVAQAVDKP